MEPLLRLISEDDLQALPWPNEANDKEVPSIEIVSTASLTLETFCSQLDTYA